MLRNGQRENGIALASLPALPGFVAGVVFALSVEVKVFCLRSVVKDEDFFAVIINDPVKDCDIGVAGASDSITFSVYGAPVVMVCDGGLNFSGTYRPSDGLD